MLEGLLALSLAVTAQANVTIDKESVPAQGSQDVVVKVAKPGMVHLGVASDLGVACTLTDHLRGPFFSDGEVGKTSCNADVLLDQGLYKLKLTAPGEAQKKKKKAPSAASAKVDVVGFSDVDAPLVLLPGRSTTTTLPLRKQVTRWLRVPTRQEVVVDVWGRTAGDVKLWRDGQWVEEVNLRSLVEKPGAGRSIHHHRIQAFLDAGDYTVVAYGTNPQQFTQGPNDDTVHMAWDAPSASSSRNELFTIPAWGVVQFKAPDGVAAFLSVDGKRSDAVTLTAEAVIDENPGRGMVRSSTTSCTLNATDVQSGCTLTQALNKQKATVLTVRGPPLTTARVLWIPLRSADNRAVGDARSDQGLTLSGDVEAIAVAGLPAGIDQAPIGCALDKLDDKGNFTGVVARDLPNVSLTQAWKRRFNSDATSTAVWLNIETPGVYGISGKLKASCEVYKLDDTLTAKKRLSDGKDGSCDLNVPLPKGPVEVRFYGGTPGIQELRVGQVGLAALVGNDGEAPMRSGCWFSGLSLTPGKHRVRTSGNAGAQLRTIFALNKGFTDPGAVVVAVDPQRTITIPVAAGAAVKAEASAGSFSCSFDGKAIAPCITNALSTSGTLTLTNTGTRPATAIVGRVAPPAPSPPLDPWNGAPPRLPVVQADKAVWFDLDGNAKKSFLVDVQKAGLFDIGTEGLLATSCAVRTAVSASLFTGEQNGRGRNCLVSSYLKPGRYLVSVDVVGSSRGRAGLKLTSRPAWAGGDLALGDERFVSVDAGALAKHTFTLKKKARVDWGITAQSGSLQCRLDDDDGWPTRAVPHACSGSEELDEGRYTLSVLPLTVESKRSLRLGEPVVQDVLTGDKTHALTLNTNYQAELGADGKDAFSFSVAANVDVGVTLGDGMQGRIYESVGGKKGEVVTALAPVGGSSFVMAAEEEEAPPEEEYVEEEYHEEEYSEDGGGDGSEGEEYDGSGIGSMGTRGGYGAPSDGGRAASAMLSATVHQQLPALSGQVVSLKAGSYILETEHARGDVGVVYNVSVFARSLLPGVVLRTQAPVVVDVKAPALGAAGLVRIKTRGQTDVACRLLDARGVVVDQSQGSGADWNCALAVPLAADHKLYVDAEVLKPGPTTITAEFLEAKDTGALKDNDSFTLKGKVAKATLTPSKGNVSDVHLTSSDDFSCAAFDADGTVLDRQVGVRACSLLLWPGESDKPFTVMAWTADRPATVKVALKERGLSSLGGLLSSSEIDDGGVAEAKVTARGRFETAPNARCLAKHTRGALLPCPVAASFDPKRDGDTILVGVTRGERAKVPFSERVAQLQKRQSDSRVLSGARAAERMTTSQKAIHTAMVTSLPGASARPACNIEGGAHHNDDDRCVAASGLTTESTLVTWTRPGGALPARVTQESITPPPASALPSGSAVVDGVARYALPNEPWRLDLAVPATAWAIQLDDGERAVDVCSPAEGGAAKGFSRCVFRGRGGSVVVKGDGTFSVRADLLKFAAFDEPARLLSGLFELRPRGPGRETLQFASSSSERALRVEGHGVRACAIHTDDGGRIPSCRAVIPAGVSGDVVVEHDGGALRATLGKTGELYANRFGPLSSSSSSSLAFGKAEVLSGTLVERRVQAPSRGVVRVRATGGVCAVANKDRVQGAEGLGGGCDLRVVVDKGEARVLVRSFGGAPLAGTVGASFEPITSLAEGVGAEALVQPGEARVFEVALLSDGELGIGVKVDAEVLECALLNTQQEVVADGCQIFGRFAKGSYFLRVEAPPDTAPRKFQPVVFGLKGAEASVPDDYLRDFFRRVPPPKESAVKEVR